MESKTVVKKKRSAPNSLSLVKCWNAIGPVVAKEIGDTGYTHIPYCTDTDAYKIGYIFAPIAAQMTCCRCIPVVRIIGPIYDYVDVGKTNSKWLNKDFRTSRFAGEKTNFEVNLGNDKDKITCAGQNYYYNIKTEDAPIPHNIVIKRLSHPDLAEARWFGLINGVMVVKSFELFINRGLKQRTFYVGDGDRTVLFKYVICKIDSEGMVIEATDSSTRLIRARWTSLDEDKLESLPLPTFTVSKTLKPNPFHLP